jgi:hypothetical protein
MGYYASIFESNVFVPKENLEKAYQAACELNNHDKLKTGGSIDGNGNREYWFAWMPKNYPEQYSDLQEILDALGFSTHEDSEGNLQINGFSDKVGDEDKFLETIAPYVNNNSHIVWIGEDNTMWAFQFIDGKMIESNVSVTID